MLQQQFAAVRATAEPIREKLGIPAMRRPPGQIRCAALLPLPLYVAYVQLAASQEAFDLPADVLIAGLDLCTYLLSVYPGAVHMPYEFLCQSLTSAQPDSATHLTAAGLVLINVLLHLLQ